MDDMPTVAEALARNAALEAELAQALERAAAISDLLRVISKSPSDMHAVLQAILDRALDLLGAQNGALHLVDGDEIRSGVVNTGGNPESRRGMDPEREFDSS